MHNEQLTKSIRKEDKNKDIELRTPYAFKAPISRLLINQNWKKKLTGSSSYTYIYYIYNFFRIASKILASIDYNPIQLFVKKQFRIKILTLIAGKAIPQSWWDLISSKTNKANSAYKVS